MFGPRLPGHFGRVCMRLSQREVAHCSQFAPCGIAVRVSPNLVIAGRRKPAAAYQASINGGVASTLGRPCAAQGPMLSPPQSLKACGGDFVVLLKSGFVNALARAQSLSLLDKLKRKTSPPPPRVQEASTNSTGGGTRSRGFPAQISKPAKFPEGPGASRTSTA